MGLTRLDDPVCVRTRPWFLCRARHAPRDVGEAQHQIMTETVIETERVRERGHRLRTGQGPARCRAGLVLLCTGQNR